MLIFKIVYGLMLINIIVGVSFVNKLDKKTRYKDDSSIGLDGKYILLFLFCNIFCYLFLNKIKEKRKIQYYISTVNYYTALEDYLTIKSDSELSYKLLKMKRYLKLKNIEYGKKH